MSIEITDERIDRLIAAVNEHTRLSNLTNEQLVLECLHSEASEADLVREMMSRLDPNWTDLTPEELADEQTRAARTEPEMPAIALTPAEQLVFDLLIEGKNNKEIGTATGTSEKTVKAHVTHIFRKFGCSSRYEVIAKHFRGEL